MFALSSKTTHFLINSVLLPEYYEIRNILVAANNCLAVQTLITVLGWMADAVVTTAQSQKPPRPNDDLEFGTHKGKPQALPKCLLDWTFELKWPVVLMPGEHGWKQPDARQVNCTDTTSQCLDVSFILFFLSSPFLANTYPLYYVSSPYCSLLSFPSTVLCPGLSALFLLIGRAYIPFLVTGSFSF